METYSSKHYTAVGKNKNEKNKNVEKKKKKKNRNNPQSISVSFPQLYRKDFLSELRSAAGRKERCRNNLVWRNDGSCVQFRGRDDRLTPIRGAAS
ncbi:hypothetical protein CEXT_693481 [Caerostris extrusa]|uniref:Uncharacterized protein n=1 Tax=Caerostris extrusa TaxID=172846 RepID=A0AAV4MAZ6_CAEEX|nr:hypothetical protein CEXT_693481 [Caerostris extrusa]